LSEDENRTELVFAPQNKEWGEISEAELRIEARLDFLELKVGQISKGSSAAFKNMTVNEPGARFASKSMRLMWRCKPLVDNLSARGAAVAGTLLRTAFSVLPDDPERSWSSAGYK
jgi:hypothetical protein